MDKQTLSNYGWVIITVLVLAVMIALATPFGTYVKEGAKSTLTGLFESSENALNTGLGEAGVTVNKAEFGGVPTVGGNNPNNIPNNPETPEQPDEPLTVVGSATFNKKIADDCMCLEFEMWHDCWVDTETTTLTWEELQLPENGIKYGYDASKITDTSVENGAFFKCSSLNSIIIPSDITIIEEKALYYAWYLESVTIENGTTTIGDLAFYYCEKMTNINIPNTVTTIESSAFGDCRSLSSIVYNGTTEQWNNITKARYWNACCYEIIVTCTDGTITIPSEFSN